MFKRVLVANRGEIALRIIRACHEEGLEAVAVYSEADRLSPHVRAADRAVPLGGVVEASPEAARLGYPVLLKAAAGGGGKGMRLVREQRELASAFEAARSEALKAFGADEVYLEKYLERPRHVEVQILADANGRVVALGEREGSIQRRPQKLIEEAPSVAVTPALRRRISDAATAAAGAAGYRSAGTIEFLLAPGREVSFLETPTPPQAEHPVTELV